MKENEERNGHGRRGVAVGVTVGLFAALAVGGYFLVNSLVNSDAANQTSNAPSQGSSAPENPAANDDSVPDSVPQSTTTRDTGAMTDSGAGVEPVEDGTSEDSNVSSGNDDHDVTPPVTEGTSGHEVTEPSDPVTNYPVNTSAVTAATTNQTSLTSTRTTAATTTTKATTTPAGSSDNWATLPEEIEEVIISETFEGSLSDFFH